VSWKLFAITVIAAVTAQSAPARHTIAGRVRGAQGGVPAGVTVSLCTLYDGGSGCGPPLALAADGSLKTGPLADATYVLVAGPSPFARAPDPAVERGLQVVTLSGRDLTDVTIHTSRYSLRGKYVMRSDNKAAKWPPHIHLVASLVIGDRAYPVGESGSTGAPNGEFLLENVLGPRVLRAGYSLGADAWWPWQVLLDGVDITDTPIDFSEHQNGRLEVVFTQHPARVTGTVIDAAGRPVTGAWLAHFSADRAFWNDWASTTEKHGSASMPNGTFSMPVRPGRYLVAAIPPTPYQVRPVWPSFEELAKTATAVAVEDRGRAEIVVRLPDGRR
jgi:hypothetical protein